MNDVIISIGTNLGGKMQNIKNATNAINLLPETKLSRVSKIYETKPFGVPNNQENYLNCCIEVFTNLSPQILMGCLLGIEAALGRRRTHRFCERIIDLDIIFYDDMKIDEKNLIVPHPRALERAFVLAPLYDMFSDMKFKNIDFSEAYKKCNKSVLIKIR